MRLPSRPSVPALGIFALLLGACPGDDGGGATTSGAPSTAAETAPPATEDGGTTMDAPTTEGMTSEATVTGTATLTGGPDDSTGAEGTIGMTTGPGVPRVIMETTLGTMVIELDEEAAPITVENFLAYVNGGFYDGTDGAGATIFHRVIPGFVIQGGGFTEAGQLKATMPPIVLEAGNGLTNDRGTIAMARTMVEDSATSQFYFNLVDNAFLDEPPGYAVFGQIVEGLEVIDAIAAVETDPQDNPLEPVVILSATLE